MTRGLTAAQQAAARGEVVRPRYLVELDFPSGFARAWSGVGSVFFDSDGDGNDEEFLGVGDFGAITEVEETVDGRATRVTVSLAGPNAAFRGVALNEHIQFRPGRVWKAYVDEDGAFIDDPFIAFEGFMDTMPVTLEGEQTVVSVHLVSPFELWERSPDTPRYSNEDHQKRFPGDKYFEFMPEIAKGKEVVWGRG